MGILSVILLVFFIIIAVLLVLLILIQNEEGDGLGGIFAGGSSTAFGSRSGNVLSRTTSILGGLFLVVSLGLALLSRTGSGSGVEEEGRRLATEQTGTSWLEDELKPHLVYNYTEDDNIYTEDPSEIQ
jgi:preprotein translocase subunit SecG